MSSLEIKHNLKFKGFNPIVLTHMHKRWKNGRALLKKFEWDKTLL